MKTITINLYAFEELKVDIQKKILLAYSDINVMDDWWMGICEDAENVGLNIANFDLSFGPSIIAYFIDSPLHYSC